MITINLLPVREERRRAGAQQLLALMGVALVASLAIVALVHWSIQSDIASSKQAAAKTQAEIDQFGPQLKQVEEYKAAKAEIEQKLDVIDDLADARSGPVHIFDQIADQVPERVWIDSIDIKGGRITLQGMSLDNELVALFLTGLEESPYFKDVELMETEARERDGFKLNAFEVSAVLTSPAAERKAAEAAEGTTTANQRSASGTVRLAGN